MIKKIISGAQTGADRAALDFAINNDIPHGGWVPKGRKAEDGIIPEHYDVKEAPTSEYSRRTELNVIDSDGTLILSHGALSGGSALTEKLAQKHGKPCLYINLNRKPEFQATVDITHWINRNGIEVLNVAGSRASHDPQIYVSTVSVLEAVLYLGIIEDKMPDFINRPYEVDDSAINKKNPETVEQTVTQLIAELPLKDKTRLAGMTETDLSYLHPSLGVYIKTNYRILNGNEKLMASCRQVSKDRELDADGAALVIIKKLWERLKKTHRIRRVK
ncbi:MAG: hypothetical protein HF978_17765 [Desulfobacteraceae bacterium]|nr:hypothetical protein [Desulfobacteraceae bacterium]MBC2757395.1 hypothetical protein [Desulfobacteraceae bacterium]